MLFCVLECEFEKFCTSAASYLIIKTSCSFLCFTSYFHTVSCFGNFSCLSREKTHRNTGKWPFGFFLWAHRGRNKSSVSSGRAEAGEPGRDPESWVEHRGSPRAPLNGCVDELRPQEPACAACVKRYFSFCSWRAALGCTLPAPPLL